MTSDSRLSQLLQFLTENPNDVFINYALGMEYLAKNDTAKAADYFQKTIALDENYTAAYYQSGKLFETTDVEKSKDFYNRGIIIAQKLNKRHELMELKEALQMLEE